jgi:predicted dehydrogenase
MRTFVPERPSGRVTVDVFAAVVEFDGSALGTIEATRYAHGRTNALTWDINGSEGLLAFDLERLNELQVKQRRVLVTEADQPFTGHPRSQTRSLTPRRPAGAWSSHIAADGRRKIRVPTGHAVAVGGARSHRSGIGARPLTGESRGISSRRPRRATTCSSTASSASPQ